MNYAVHNFITIYAVDSPLKCVVSIFLLKEMWAQVYTSATVTVTIAAVTCAPLFYVSGQQSL